MKTLKIIILALLALVVAQSVLAAPSPDRTPKKIVIIDRYYPPELPVLPKPAVWRSWWSWFTLWP